MWVKICGVTTLEDAEACIEAGADAVGLNLVVGSPRRVEIARAREIADGCRGRVELVGVISDLPVPDALRLRTELGLDLLQLHGEETPAMLEALLPAAYKAVRIGGAADVAAAERFLGERLLVDAKVPGQLGGTGRALDPGLVVALARRRRLVLARGLRPESVADAIRVVRPWGVDVASGVEASAGVKSRAAVRAFVRAAKAE